MRRPVARQVAELVSGIHPVAVLLERASDRVSAVYILEGARNPRLQAIVERATANGVAVHRLAREELEALLPGERHQGVVARTDPRMRVPLPPLEALVRRRGDSALLLVLDGVQDPHNLGACLRSADAAGVDAVIVPRDRACPVTPAVHRAAAGAAHVLPLYRVANLARALRQLKNDGVWLVGADASAGRSLYRAALRGPLALVLGGEGSGLRRLTREACDLVVGVPMRGVVASLNVSVAAALMLFEADRQRRAAISSDRLPKE